MNPEQFKQAIDFAKNNPDDPRAVELRRRIESGAMNTELQSAGMKTFEVKPPPQSAYSTSTASSTPEQSKSPFFDVGLGLDKWKERGMDIVETGKGFLKQGLETGKDIKDIVTDEDFTVPQKFMGTAGRLAGGISGAVGEVTTGLGKLALTDEGEQKVADLMAKVGEKIGETEIAQGISEWYGNLDKDGKLFVDSVGGVAALAAEVAGLKGGGKIASKTAEATGQGIKKGKELATPVIKATGEVIEESLEKRAVNNAIRQSKQVEDAVGRILQGSPEDIEVGKRALRNIDTEGVQTYEQLNTRIDDRITAIAKKVDSELAKYPERYRNEQLGKYTKVGDETVVENPVIDAMNGLEDAYTKSGEAVKLAQLRQLRTKLEREGLTVLELNNFARQYGVEFKDKAFTKLGDPKPGYNAENFENIRTSLKNVVRERIPDDVPKELDSQMTDLYKTQALTTKMEENVQKLYQKIKNRSLMQKLGGAVADVVDLASLGTMRGFVQKLLPSNVGLKTANSLDLQEELARNLKKIERMLDSKATDAEVLQGVADMLNTAR